MRHDMSTTTKLRNETNGKLTKYRQLAFEWEK